MDDRIREHVIQIDNSTTLQQKDIFTSLPNQTPLEFLPPLATAFNTVQNKNKVLGGS
jgi:hypothetical protein